MDAWYICGARFGVCFKVRLEQASDCSLFRHVSKIYKRLEKVFVHWRGYYRIYVRLE